MEEVVVPTSLFEFLYTTGLKLEDVWLQIIPLISGMVHILVGALVFWAGGRFKAK